ncbi:nucleotide-binding protein [Vibrio mimicus]
MSDYYHVILETKEKDAKKRPVSVFWFDCQDLEELDEDIITPYVKRSTLYIDGRQIDFSNIQALTIKKSSSPIDHLVRQANARTAPGVFVVFTRGNVVRSDRDLENVTKSIVKAKQKELESSLVAAQPAASSSLSNSGDSNKVFIVHGHDNEAKLDMARFIEKAGLEAIVLHEQVSAGNTIIEKIEANNDVGFAVVLYTPCDVGARNSQDMELLPRARQNVVFEHGYFIGHLGRNRVSAFVKSDIEKPNDISGVVYTELDHAGAWKVTLLKELKAAGYQVDPNALL